jgi:nicotinate-nucleotide adenylyltransferase
MPRPLILFGGSFDPIHQGHLALAMAVHAQAPHAEIRLMPTAQSPFKHTQTSTRHRLALLRLALRDTPFSIERIELQHPSPTYTIDTLSHIRQRIGAIRPLIFILGQDSLHSLPRWKGGFDLLSKTHLWVFGRGARSTPLQLSDELFFRQVNHPQMLENSPAGRVYVDPYLAPNISSTQVREQLATSRSLVPARVWAYNRKSSLYGF